MHESPVCLALPPGRAEGTVQKKLALQLGATRHNFLANRYLSKILRYEDLEEEEHLICHLPVYPI